MLDFHGYYVADNCIHLSCPGSFKVSHPKVIPTYKGSFNAYVDIVLSFFDHLKANCFKNQTSSSSFLLTLGKNDDDDIEH